MGALRTQSVEALHQHVLLVVFHASIGMICVRFLPPLQIQIDGERAYQSRNVIALDESRLVIYKDTAVNHHTER